MSNYGSLEGKVALVTGSARGIGQAIALKFASLGADVIVADLKAEWCSETVAAVEAFGRKAYPVAVDVSKEASVEAGVADAVAKFGKLDICVNNAGITKDGLLLRMTEADWDAVLNINLKGVFFVSKAVAKVMIKQRSGAIVNIASIVGLIGQPGQCNYSASKAGVIALTKSSAKELASRGIRVNAVAPGFINSKMTEVLPDGVKQQMLSLIPQKRFGEADDIAKVVAFLAGDEASYVTGQTISVNGGMAMF